MREVKLEHGSKGVEEHGYVLGGICAVLRIYKMDNDELDRNVVVLAK